MTEVKVIHGDSLEVLKGYSSDHFSALVTDPPAGIAFMGKQFDTFEDRAAFVGFLSGIMRECYRTMRPGAHGVVWALPRTSHWTAWALEEAGFDIRHVVTHIYGTGFPKGADVGKAIDKAAGLERDVIGVKPGHEGFAVRTTDGDTRFNGAMEGFHRPWMDDPTQRAASHAKTAPASPEGQQWDGWNTALKPAHENWIIVRKPLSEATVAKNVLRWGTGALNINGGRIRTADNLSGGAYAKDGQERHDGSENWRYKRLGGAGEYEAPAGRWPPDIAFSHSSACRRVGTKQVRNPSGSLTGDEPSNATRDVYGDLGRHSWEKYGDADGLETLEAWECVEGCPVKELDGGASRFFPIFPADAAMFLYQPKPPSSERGEENLHPTVKSIDLMKWLITLVAPPNGIIVDPFFGSGSTGIAAQLLGFDCVGIEREAAYVTIARDRLVLITPDLVAAAEAIKATKAMTDDRPTQGRLV